MKRVVAKATVSPRGIVEETAGGVTFITWGEMMALSLIPSARNANVAGDQIIQLSERIKSERAQATASMAAEQLLRPASH